LTEVKDGSVAFNGGNGREPTRVTFAGGATLGLLLLLGGCSTLDAVNPVTWYHDITGTSTNEPGANAANTANLEKGSKEPYPNLASVPPPPTRGLSEEEKDALTRSLVSDREHARYTDGGPVAGSAPLVVGAAAGSAGSGVIPQHRAKTPAGPVAADRESSLTTPTPRPVPAGDTPQAPPEPPDIKPAPAPSPDADMAAPLPTAPPPAPTAIASAGGPTGPVVPPAGKAPKHTKSTQVAEVGFAGAAPDAAGAKALETVPALHVQYGGTVRIIGYAAVAAGADPQLAAYQAGLARAQTVKQALIAAGIPAAEIVAEASPVPGGGAVPNRADIYLEY